MSHSIFGLLTAMMLLFSIGAESALIYVKNQRSIYQPSKNVIANKILKNKTDISETSVPSVLLHRLLSNDEVKKNLDNFTMKKMTYVVNTGTLPPIYVTKQNGYQTHRRPLLLPPDVPYVSYISQRVVNEIGEPQTIIKQILPPKNENNTVIINKKAHGAPPSAFQGMAVKKITPTVKKLINNQNFLAKQIMEHKHMRHVKPQNGGPVKMTVNSNYVPYLKMTDRVNMQNDLIAGNKIGIRNENEIESNYYGDNIYIKYGGKQRDKRTYIDNYRPHYFPHYIESKYIDPKQTTDPSDTSDLYGTYEEPIFSDYDAKVQEILSRQVNIFDNFAKYIQNLEILRKKNNDFDDLLKEMEEKKLEEKNKASSKKEAKQKIPTVQTLIDETEVRNTLKKDPYIQRILKMASKKKAKYIQDAKKYFKIT